MTLRRAATTALTIAVVAIIVAAAIIAGYWIYPRPSQSGHISTTTGQSSNSVTLFSNVTNGLQLVATLKPVIAQPGRNISVVAQVRNTLQTSIKVNTTSIINPAYGPCQQGVATGVYAYQGHYTSVNLSKATELLLYNPSLIYTCPAVFSFQYTFSPNSNVATVQPNLNGFQPKNSTGPVNETSFLSGYWAGLGQSYVYYRFPSGTYTVKVFDAWGQTLVASFQVSATTSTASIPLNESCASSSQGKSVEWNTVVTAVLKGDGVCLGQFHNRTVVLTLRNGTKWATVEPAIDDIFQVYKQCGSVCANMTLVTE